MPIPPYEAFINQAMRQGTQGPYCLEDPGPRHSLLASAAKQALEHADHDSLLSSEDSLRLRLRLPSHLEQIVGITI